MVWARSLPAVSLAPFHFPGRTSLHEEGEGGRENALLSWSLLRRGQAGGRLCHPVPGRWLYSRTTLSFRAAPEDSQTMENKNRAWNSTLLASIGVYHATNPVQPVA